MQLDTYASLASKAAHLISQKDLYKVPPRPKPMIICEECGELLQRSSLGRHRQRRHGAPTASIRDILPLKNNNNAGAVTSIPSHMPRMNASKAGRKPKHLKEKHAYYDSASPYYHSRPVVQSASTSSSLNGSEYGDDEFDDLSNHSMAFNESDTLNSSMLHAPTINRTLLQSERDGDLHPCNQCERSFTWKTNLRRHEKTVHGMIGDRAFIKKIPRSGFDGALDKPYQCDTCDCAYTEKVNLRRHQREKHGSDCIYTARGNKGIRREYNGQIPIEEPLPLNEDDALPWLRRYECMDCGLAYATQEELDVHDMARHEHRRVQTSFVCAYCPATFATQDKCVRHESNHQTTPRFVCQQNQCAAKFYVPMMKEYHESMEHLGNEDDNRLDENDYEENDENDGDDEKELDVMEP